MRLYTGKGDQGETDLLGERVTKNDPRIVALGALDEASCAMGLGRAMAQTDQSRAALLQAQRDLYAIMAELAFTDDLRPEAQVFPAERVTWLETITDTVMDGLSLPPAFVVPGDTAGGAALDIARSVVRRAERDVLSLTTSSTQINEQIGRYLNRLSSLLFALARAEDHAAGVVSTPAKTSAARRETGR